MHITVLDLIHSGNVDELQEMVQRSVDATCRGEAHEMKAFAAGLCIAESRLDFRILQDGVVGTGTVDLHQILIDDATCADIEMPRLGVAHLPVWQAHVRTRSLQLGVRIAGLQLIHVRRGGPIDHVSPAPVADSPTVENDQ